jgi:hypothetical protein
MTGFRGTAIRAVAAAVAATLLMQAGATPAQAQSGEDWIET